MDTYWLKASKLYRDNELPGVAHVRAPRMPKDRPTGTIMFYCAPKDDIPLMKKCGRTIAEKMNYVSRSGKLHFRVLNEDQESIIACSLDVPTAWAARSQRLE